MEPPQIVTEELINKIREFLKKPENIGFVAGFSLTIILGFTILSNLYTKRKDPKKAAHEYAKDGKSRKKGIFSHLVDYGLEYGLIFFLTLMKEKIQNYLKDVNEDIKEYKEELKGE